MRVRGIGWGGMLGTLVTRSCERERSGLTTWETEGGALAMETAGSVRQPRNTKRRIPARLRRR